MQFYSSSYFQLDIIFYFESLKVEKNLVLEITNKVCDLKNIYFITPE